jgi:hypothetical protein
MATGEGRRTHVKDAGLWIARVRLIVVLFAVADVALMSRYYPSGYEEAAWITTGVFAVGAIALFFASKRYSSAAGPAGARVRRVDRRYVLDDLLVRVRKPYTLGVHLRHSRGRPPTGSSA